MKLFGGRQSTVKRVKGEMARQLVWLCMRVLLGTTVWAMVVKTIGVFKCISVDLSDVLIFVGGAFGGELLFLCLKRIFAKDRPEEVEENEAKG